MFYKLKHIYFTVYQPINRFLNGLLLIWLIFIRVLRAVTGTINAIGYAIVRFIGASLLFLKYSLILTSVLSFLIFIIGSLLGFKMSIYLPMLSCTGFIILFLVWLGSAIGRAPYEDY